MKNHYHNLIKKAEIIISRELDKNSRNVRILKARIKNYQKIINSL